MKIINNYCQSKQSFTSTRMRTLDKAGNVLCCNYTNLNREDLDWQKFARFLQNRYFRQSRVKINLYGCSDGSDAYTLTINLIKELGTGAKKFFPILASDISEPVIKTAKEGKILLHSKDLDYLDKLGARHYFERDYNEPVQIMRNIEFFPHHVSKQLRETVDFSIKDVNKSVKNHDFSDEVFIFRNGWTFNTLENQNQLARNLHTNSNNKTLVVIGQSDLFKSDASDALQRNCFRGIMTDIFTRKETDYPSKSIGQPMTSPLYPKEFILFEKRL